MAKIKLLSGFSLLPEGVTVFKITEVDESNYEKFGKLVVTMQTKEGKTHREKYSLIKQVGNRREINEGALKAWSYFARTCLNNNNVDEIDTQDIVGCYLKATIYHEPYTDNDGNERIAERIKDYEVASGFENVQQKAEADNVEFVDLGDDIDFLEFD